jgi:hypothetical protein
VLSFAVPLIPDACLHCGAVEAVEEAEQVSINYSKIDSHFNECSGEERGTADGSSCRFDRAKGNSVDQKMRKSNFVAAFCRHDRHPLSRSILASCRELSRRFEIQ